MSNETATLNIDALEKSLGMIAYTLDRDYLSRLDRDYTIIPFDEYYNSEEIEIDGKKELLPRLIMFQI